MKIILENPEIKKFIEESLQKRSTSKVSVSNFKITGSRSTEGYSMIVEVQYDDIDYTEEVYEESNSSVDEPVKEKPSKPKEESKPFEYNEQDAATINVLNELLTNNIFGRHNNEILELYSKANDVVKEHFKSNSILHNILNTSPPFDVDDEPAFK